MYLNVNSRAPSPPPPPPGQSHQCDGGDDACTTPEIITSLITMATTSLSSPVTAQSGGDCCMVEPPGGGGAYCPSMTAAVGGSAHNHELTPLSSAAEYSYMGGGPLPPVCSMASSPAHRGGPIVAPPCSMYAPCSPSIASSPPSIQATRTHLIKESLKVTIQCKRLASGHYLPSAADLPKCFIKEELTPEDEDRRRRRRERNKVAATKCRNKKKERTVTLLMESDSLEQTNMSLRTEIQRLEVEKQRLLDMLNYHIPACALQGSATSHVGPSPMTTTYLHNPCSIVGL